VRDARRLLVVRRTAVWARKTAARAPAGRRTEAVKAPERAGTTRATTTARPQPAWRVITTSAGGLASGGTARPEMVTCRPLTLVEVMSASGGRA
jgi:hypothetical protein